MTEKIYVNDNNIATFICPQCNASKSRDIAEYKRLERAVRLKIKCSCGNSYTVILERRRHYRKETGLPGRYVYCPSGGKLQTGTMTVVDISRGGLKLEFRIMPKFLIGDIFSVEFNLDDSQQTLIKKEVVTRMVTDRFINAEFCLLDSSEPGDRALRFYLF